MDEADSSVTTAMYNKALEVAVRFHEGQRDRAGAPYILHPLRVADRSFVRNDEVLRCVAVLHDVVEDTDMTLEGLAAEGFPNEVVEAVDAITHRQGEPLDDYYARVKANRIAAAVKLADIADNNDEARLSLLDPAVADRLRAKYKHALEVLYLY